jgi:hypothetical protein
VTVGRRSFHERGAPARRVRGVKYPTATLIVLLAVLLSTWSTWSNFRSSTVVPNGTYSANDGSGDHLIISDGHVEILTKNTINEEQYKWSGQFLIRKDGTFAGAGLSSGQYDVLFMQMRWKWNTDHFERRVAETITFFERPAEQR